ncbi:hypothetical protein BVIET440_20360 [Burkholderia vietnamiensis]
MWKSREALSDKRFSRKKSFVYKAMLDRDLPGVVCKGTGCSLASACATRQKRYRNRTS